MVKGIEIFQEYFKEYTDQYVLIGGVAFLLRNRRLTSDEQRKILILF